MLKVFDVGHGQCILFCSPNGRVVLIDCAYHPGTGWNPTDALLGHGIQHVDALVVSNFDEDHVRGLRELGRRIRIGRVWPNWRVTPQHVRTLKNHDLGDGIDILLKALDRGFGSGCDMPDAPWLGCDIFRTWALSPSDYWPYDADTNALSVVTEIRLGGIGVLVGGDMPTRGWQILLQNQEFRKALANIDVFVASHHGREDGCCDEMFATGWRPRVVITSDERHGHDTQVTGQYYRQRSLGMWFDDGETRHVIGTDRYGTISMEFPSYGRYTIRTERGRKAPPLAQIVPDWSQTVAYLLGNSTPRPAPSGLARIVAQRR